MSNAAFVPLPAYRAFPTDEMKRRAAEFRAEMQRRRTVREFSERAVPREVIEECVRAAGTAPNSHYGVTGADTLTWVRL
jgi:iodotyrosine deiodinase